MRSEGWIRIELSMRESDQNVDVAFLNTPDKDLQQSMEAMHRRQRFLVRMGYIAACRRILGAGSDNHTDGVIELVANKAPPEIEIVPVEQNRKQRRRK